MAQRGESGGDGIHRGKGDKDSQQGGGGVEDYKPPSQASREQRVNISKDSGSRRFIYVAPYRNYSRPGLYGAHIQLGLRTLAQPRRSEQILTEHPVTPRGGKLKNK